MSLVNPTRNMAKLGILNIPEIRPFQPLVEGTYTDHLNTLQTNLPLLSELVPPLPPLLHPMAQFHPFFRSTSTSPPSTPASPSIQNGPFCAVSFVRLSSRNDRTFRRGDFPKATQSRGPPGPMVTLGCFGPSDSCSPPTITPMCAISIGSLPSKSAKLAPRTLRECSFRLSEKCQHSLISFFTHFFRSHNCLNLFTL